MNDQDRRVAALELQITRLTELADAQRQPVTHFFLRHNATWEQQSAIYRLFDDSWQAMRRGEEVNPADLEREIGAIFRKPKDAHILAVEIVNAFAELGSFSDLVSALKKTGWL